MSSHTEDTPNRCNNSKNQFKQSKINNSTISKLENDDDDDDDDDDSDELVLWYG